MRWFSPNCFRRKSLLMMSLSTLALAGCGGGDGSGDVSWFTISPNPGGSGTFGSFYMASITQEWRDAAASFRNNNPRFTAQNGTFTINNVPVFANPLQSSRVDYAHALGLTGAGQVIAVVDEGFMQNHEVFNGKTKYITGSLPENDHGTMVAAIAAGNSSTMVGVAPSANLIFSSWNYVDLAEAAYEARIRGAVAQNNSWGFIDTYADQAGYNAIFSDPTGQNWLSSLQQYAANGVVVFAMSNNAAETRSGLMDGLPALVPALESGWIAVGNAIPVFDDSGVSAVARRESSSCLQAARWCMVADGYWVSATGPTNSSYGEGTGSSFAAPQVSGALALLAQAFPNLTPHQLRARLLASADNTFTGFATSGTSVVDIDPGPGVYNHTYSNEFGHGFLDIRAALLPIGPTGLSVGDGETIATKDFAFTTGGAMGDAVARSLAGIDLTVNDALGGDFSVAAKDFATEAKPSDLAQTMSARAMAKDFRTARTAPINPLSDTFAAHPGSSFDMNTPDGLTHASILIGDAEDYGLAVARTLSEGALTLDLGVKLARDGGSLMGFSGSGTSGGASMAALTMSLSHDMGQGGFFALSGEMGVADLGSTSAIRAAGQASFNSVRLDLGGRDVFGKGDRLSVGVALPMAVSSGSADMTMPVRSADGRTEVRSVGIDLAPDARQVDLSISYQVPTGDNSELMFQVIHADNYGNIAGNSDSAAMLGMKWSF